MWGLLRVRRLLAIKYRVSLLSATNLEFSQAKRHSRAIEGHGRRIGFRDGLRKRPITCDIAYEETDVTGCASVQFTGYRVSGNGELRT